MKTNLTQSEQFKILWDFFAKHGAEVEGHGSDEMLPDQKAAIALLASGKADNATRKKLLPLLRSNKHALAYLGDQIKLIRPSATRKPQPTRRGSSRPKPS
jgi:hypothetical protein